MLSKSRSRVKKSSGLKKTFPGVKKNPAPGPASLQATERGSQDVSVYVCLFRLFLRIYIIAYVAFGGRQGRLWGQSEKAKF